MENAALLARVSGKGQEDNSSPQAQLRRGREYCAQKGYNIAAERIEVMSGAFVLARSVYNDLLNLAADGQVSVIVADIPDRLGRGDAIAKLELLAQLNGARVEYAQPGRDKSTIEGLVQHSAEQMVSGIERLNIRRRTMGGKRAWAERGRVIATPYRPYGFRFVTTRDVRGRVLTCDLAVVEDEGRNVHQIYEWLVYEHLTTYGIAQRLNAMHTPTRCMTDYPERRISGWDRTVIHHLVKSTVYKGQWRYAKQDIKRIDTSDGIRLTRTLRNESDTVIVPCPAIVSEELWQAAQAQLELNKAKFRKPTKYRYLLRGRVTCARCEGAWCGTAIRRGGQPLRVYRCGHSTRPSLTRCKAVGIKADILEAATWGVVCEEAQNLDILIRKAKEDQSKSSSTRRVIEQHIAVSYSQVDKANARYNRYERLYGDGDLSQEKLVEYRKERDTEIEKRLKEIAGWQKELTAQPAISPDFEIRLRKLMADMGDRLTPDTPYERKLQLIDMLSVNCTYDDRIDYLKVEGVFGERTVPHISACTPLPAVVK
jgi:DNA invertase Pin-like site-specific DNA recombinase